MRLSKFVPILILAIITCLLFFKIFTKGLYPIPGDLLVSFYFPWYSGGWEGYNSWTTHKEIIGGDAIRQIYPWKEFAMNQFKNSQLPLWNPYTFSGQPFAANFQSSVYYPLNLIYFLLNSPNAWILLIVSQPFLGGLFRFLAIRSFKVSQVASLFAALTFMFSSYMLTWVENGNISHSYIWLPLAVYTINKYFEISKVRYLLILIFSLTFSIFGGHPQTAIYIFIFTLMYWIFKTWQNKSFIFFDIVKFSICLLFSLTLAGIQLIPTYDFYQKSPISLPFSGEIFDKGIFPLNNLITFFASAFFGHPANNNYWSKSYGDFTPYFGVVPLVFALWGIYRLWNQKFIRFACLVSLFFMIAATHGPVTWAIKTFRIPLLDSTTPSRFISISIFLLIIISALAFDDFLKNFNRKDFLKKLLNFQFLILLIYLGIWFFTIFGKNYLKSQDLEETNLAVTRRNLILPTAMFLSLFTGSISLMFLNKLRLAANYVKAITVIGIFTVVITGGIYYTNKYLPMAPKKFIFPDHPVFDWLKTNAGINRFYGGGTARIDYNFPIHYKVFSVEGYDTLRLKRYAELLAASRNNGIIPQSYLRSDAALSEDDNIYKLRLYELLGIKYLLDKEDTPQTGADWHYERFPSDIVKGVWQYERFQIYERKNVLPRFFLTTDYQVINNDQEIIDKIFDPNFKLTTLILEKNPPIDIRSTKQDIQIPKLIKYQPNEIIFETNQTQNSLLFLSDAHDDDWNVYVDGQKSNLLRTHYALRSVAAPKGVHAIKFKYEPILFYIGASLSLISILLIVLLTRYSIRKRAF